MRKAFQPMNRSRDTIQPGRYPVITRMTSAPQQQLSVIGYMCATDWRYEIGSAADGNRVYPSVDALKRELNCWEECGIVEVEVKIKATILEPTI
jgi:hypothetical protein